MTRVTVRTDRGRIRYAVTKVAVYSKGAVADHAERLFSQDVPGRLVLVTCEDWDGQRYLSNVVVLATPTSALTLTDSRRGVVRNSGTAPQPLRYSVADSTTSIGRSLHAVRHLHRR